MRAQGVLNRSLLGPQSPGLLSLRLALVVLLASAHVRGEDRFDPQEARSTRVLYATAGGSLGAAAGGLAGLGLGFVLMPTLSRAAKDDKQQGAIIGGMGLLGAYVGLGLGVNLAGDVSGANGTYWAAAAGELVGLGVGSGLTYLGTKLRGFPRLLFIVTGLTVLPLAGAITGYELSTKRTGTEPTGQQADPLRRFPIANFSIPF